MRCMFLVVLSVSVCLEFIASPASAQRGAVRRPGGNADSVINLPYNAIDASGAQWMLYPGGWMREQTNEPLYSQGALLLINGNQIGGNNQARLDANTGEIIFDNLSNSGTSISISRRVLIDKQGSYVRYIEVFRNAGQQELSLNVQFTTNFNYGIQSSQLVADPRDKDRQIAWVGQLQAGHSVVEMYGVRGAKLVPQIIPQPDNNVVQASMQLTVPAHGQVALLHVHCSATTMDAGAELVNSIKLPQLLAGIPHELRKTILNIPASQTIGDREVLRGEMLDVIELRGGQDQLKGTLIDKSYKLQSSYGPIELPAQRIVGLMNIGQYRPRQLLVTVDGEVFGGALEQTTIALQLSSGQVTQVPLGQISRIGCRKRSGEPEEWTFDHPMIVLRSGERMNIAMPTAAFEVITRYGLLNLKPESIAAILLQTEDHGVHEIILNDGSRFAGLVRADLFNMQLVDTSGAQNVSFPAATVARIQFNNKSSDEELADDDAPMLQLTNQDLLVGTISGQLKLDTAFDTLDLNGAELRALTHSPDAAMDVQAVLWDQSAISGQLRDAQITCALRSGVSLNVPVPLIERYSNPQPRPSAAMIQQIKAVVAELGAEDWKQRDRAEAQLVAMGPVIAGVLKELSSAQPPEARQRIESVLRQIEKKKSSDNPPVPASSP